MTKSNAWRLDHLESGMTTSMKELIDSLLDANGQVIVIDDGAPFKPADGLLDGTFIEVSSESNVCLNPFSVINEEMFESDPEYREEATQLLNLIIGQMCRGPGTTNNVEKAVITRAINGVWRQYKGDATITNIAEFLLSLAYREKQAHNLGFALEPFSKGGSYSMFFEGKVNLSLDAPYCAFKFNSPAMRQGLPCIAQRMVLMSLIFLVSEKMLHGRGPKVTSLVMDKAWECLSDEHLNYFVYRASRRPRKHNGVFMSGLGSIDNFYKNKAALNMLMNSSLIKARRNDQGI